jgi:hypothetical protein
VPGDSTVLVTDADSLNTCTLPTGAATAVRLTVTVNKHSFGYDN